MVPSDPFPSVIHHRHARSESGIRDRPTSASSLLPALFRKPKINARKNACKRIPDRSRYLKTAFHSPRMAIRIRMAFLRSLLPTCLFGISSSFFQARSALPPLSARFAPFRLRAAQPVACLPPDDPGVFRNFHSPSGVFMPLRIKAFNFEPTRKLAWIEARSAFAPRCQPSFERPASDQRSGSATSLQTRWFHEPLGTTSIIGQTSV